jgi:MinD-like ATPase involved in chromosome partitioning or flagellar assembly
MLGEPGHGEMRQQGQQAPPRELSTTGPRQGVHWSSGAGGGDSVIATPPTGWNYVDSIATRELLPTRKVPPARGWRRVIYNATFGRINPGQSPDERRHAELMTKMRTPLRGHYKIGVLGKGGVGKTTVAASVGSILARLRLEDRVVAIDADASFGKLGSRVDPDAPGSYWDLAADEHLDTFADLRSQVGNNADGLFVLPGGSATAQRRVLDPAIYREATARLDRHFTISIIDCGATVDSPVTLEVLRDVDALIVVSSPWVDGASAAAQTMEWLATLGMRDLLHRTVVVLNDSDGHADKRTRTILAQQFANEGQVVIEVPFDPHLRPGGVIDVYEINSKTRRRFYELAAAIAEHFSDTAQRPRQRRFRRGGMGSRGSSVS